MSDTDSRPPTSTSDSSSGKQTDSNATTIETTPSFYGIGSVAGKAIYALGEFVLDSFDLVVLRLKVGAIRRLILADVARNGPYNDVLKLAQSSKYGGEFQHSALNIIFEKIKSRKFRHLTEAICRLPVNMAQKIFDQIFKGTREMLLGPLDSNVDMVSSICDFITHFMEQMKGVQPEKCNIRQAILDAGLVQWLGKVKAYVDATTKPGLEQICSGDDIQKLIDRMAGAGRRMWGTHKYCVVHSESLKVHNPKLVTRLEDSTIYLRSSDPETGNDIDQPVLEGCDGADLIWVAFSPDGNCLSAVSKKGIVYMWHLIKKRLIWKRSWSLDDAFTLWTLSFSPDGRCIVLGLDDGTVRVWNSETGDPIGEPLKGAPEYKHIELSPNGGRIALSGKNNKICVWDVASAAVIAVLQRHDCSVRFLTFCEGGSRIVTQFQCGMQLNKELGAEH